MSTNFVVKPMLVNTLAELKSKTVPGHAALRCLLIPSAHPFHQQLTNVGENGGTK